MKRYWTADLHLAHGNICRYCNRPWLKREDLDENGEFANSAVAVACAERMTQGLINLFNQKVKEGDSVVHIGDFFNKGRANKVEGMRGVTFKTFLGALNGSWTLLEGNHDRQNKVKTTGQHLFSKISKYRIFVSHYPLYSDVYDPDLLDFVGKACNFALVGHVHDKWKEQWVKIKGRKPILNINVGVDVRNWLPLSDSDIVEIYERAVRK